MNEHTMSMYLNKNDLICGIREENERLEEELAAVTAERNELIMFTRHILRGCNAAPCEWDHLYSIISALEGKQ